MLVSTALVSLLPLLLLAANADASSSSGLQIRTPIPRNYDTHTYYALELPEAADEQVARAAALALGAELVEPLGELAGHWIVKREDGGLSGRGIAGDYDPVLARYEVLRSVGHERRALGVPSLRGIERLVPQQRTKRVLTGPNEYKRGSPMRHPRSYTPWDVEPRDDAELLFLQNDLGLKDPELHTQWHLANQEDRQWELNVSTLWSQGVTGKGVHVVIVDDGLDYEHEDLAPNYFAEGSWDFNDNGPSPSPKLNEDQHGTRCAGEVAAAPNDVCGVGVAYNTNIAGVRILSGPITNADEAAALNYQYQLNDIFSCSWGPPDDGKSMEAPDGVILKSLVNGVQKGRGGKGSLFVFAAGNGGGNGDQCNFDGYTNSIFSVTVGAVDHAGQHPYYSEMCSAMMVVAPSSGSGQFIHTTDVKHRCATNHGGTSAAAPLVAGVFALALQVRPELGWRDFQHLAVRHAVMLHPEDEDWDTISLGRKYSYKCEYHAALRPEAPHTDQNPDGFGRIDAGLFVEAARTWELVKPQAWFDSPMIVLPDTPPPPPPPAPTATDAPSPTERDEGDDTVDGAEPTDVPTIDPPQPEPVIGSYIVKDGIKSTFEVTQQMLDDSNFERLEHVTVRVWIKHQRRGDVEVALRSPTGILSVLAQARRFDSAGSGFEGWKFMSLKHWEENPVGTWEITVRDQNNPQNVGSFQSWALQLWGEAQDASKAKDWRPAEFGQPDEEEVGSDPMPTTQLPQKPKPTDLLPSDHGHAGGAVLPTTSPASTDEDIAEPSASSDADNEAGADEGVFDGIDALRKHSAWLGGAFLIVLLAALGGGGYFLLAARRKRQRLFGLHGGDGARGAYAPVPEDVPLSLMERGRRAVGMRREGESKELYDAFGDGPSDESDDEVDEHTALRYHDSFLDDHDGEDEDATPQASGSGSRTAAGEPPAYHDDDEGESANTTSSPAELVQSTSSGSWQDAADDVRRD